jgi:Rne/Rng family ribonuclease
MQKELIIATSPQETKVAVLEDDELVEYYIERHRSQSIVGNIYKGKVTKVLPGMQSAFVDIGLERDAFLYVSDFFEDTEEYEKIVSTVEDEVAQLQDAGHQPAPVVIPTGPFPVQPIDTFPAPASEPLDMAPQEGTARPEESYDRRGLRRRDRDRDRRGKKPKIPSFESKVFETRDERTYGGIEVLPGESLAKYAGRVEPAPESPPEPVEAETIVQHLQERAVDSAAESAETVDLTPQAPPQAPEEIPLRWSEPALPRIADIPPEVTEGGVATPVNQPLAQEKPPLESVRPADENLPDQPKAEPPQEEKPEPPPSSARITDRSNDHRMTHRSSSRRQRRRGGSPGKPEEHRANGHAPKTGAMISELLREGQEILVQVAKEPLGKKGARITSHIALPGRYLVYMPTVDHIGVSRKIASEEERGRLKRIIHENRNGLPGGFIVRTAAEGRGEEEFIQDLRFLGNLWGDIRARSEKRSAPTLIHRDLNLVQRMLRDQLSPDFRAIRIDNENEFATVLEFVNKFQPALVNRVKLHLKDTPIFEEYGLNTEIDRALRPKVWLKSGGYIVINQTEALVAIDVNTGKYVGKSNRLEDTIVRTNVDAVHEIVRQIRLRNLGGIIVVDFIDMEEKKNRQRVMAALEEALRADRSPSKILQFNDFGLVAITRKRTQPSLERTLCSPCVHCNGSGWTKSPETICYEIQQEVKKMAHELEGKEIIVRVHPEVAKALKSGEFVSTHDLEEWTKKDIVVKSDPLLHEELFNIS